MSKKKMGFAGDKFSNSLKRDDPIQDNYKIYIVNYSKLLSFTVILCTFSVLKG